MICDNLDIIRKRIEEAAARSGRNPADITLIAVSKFHPAEAVREAMAAGQYVFGENKAQEMVSKRAEIGDPAVKWHFIGNLQRNKVKQVVGNAVLIHSVNSLELAKEIEKVSAARELVSDILIEVNIADESTKQGMDAAAAIELVREASAMPHLRVKCLMCIAPPVESPEENRVYFKAMRELAGRIGALKLSGVFMDELSMGMSGDFETAVEEGATMVRVGTAIFGERHYTEK